jgi:hypothetical protein
VIEPDLLRSATWTGVDQQKPAEKRKVGGSTPALTTHLTSGNGARTKR